MSKRYLGMICFLYSGIIAYVLIFNKLKNFLAPQMQIYIKLSLFPMIIIGLVMLLNNKVNYKFKVSDLVLILPLILLIIAGDGRLTSSLATNRTVRNNIENRIKKDNSVVETKNETKEQDNETIVEKKGDTLKNETIEKYEFSSFDFDIKDSSYYDLADYITYNPKSIKFVGKSIRIRGFVVKGFDYMSKEYFAIGKYGVSCCVADSSFMGLYAKYSGKVEENKWYEIEGILSLAKDSEDYDVIYIDVKNIKEIDSKNEEHYVYPCYTYDNGKCKELSKYDLEY